MGGFQSHSSSNVTGGTSRAASSALFPEGKGAAMCSVHSARQLLCGRVKKGPPNIRSRSLELIHVTYFERRVFTVVTKLENPVMGGDAGFSV